MSWRQSRLCVRQLGRGTRAAATQRARVKCVVPDKPSDARLRNQASVTQQNVRKRLICDLPYLSRTMTGSASKAEKVPNFIKTNISQKMPSVNLKKKCISGSTKASAFEWHASFVLGPLLSPCPLPRKEAGGTRNANRHGFSEKS